MWEQIKFALNQSTHRALFKLASFLPGLLAMLVDVSYLSLPSEPFWPRCCAGY